MRRFTLLTLENLSSFERGQNQINDLLKKNAEKLRKLGIPVDDECRLDIHEFNYPEEKKFRDSWDEERLKQKFDYKNRSKQLGEQFERLKTVLLQKYFKEEFIVCRTAFIDDVFNGVDNIIMDRNGNVVCAFDEVSDIHSKRYEEKREKIMEVNRIGGASIDYGIKLNPKDNKIELGPLSHLPLFFLALNETAIKQTIRQFSENEETDFEKQIIYYFAKSLNDQANLANHICNPKSEVAMRIKNFQTHLEKIVHRYNPNAVKSQK